MNLFNDSLQSRMFSQHKHFDLAQLDQHWQVRRREEECYVCNKYQSYRIFYRRSLAHNQFTKISDQLEISALRRHLEFQRQGKQSLRDPYHSLPILLGSILDQDIPSLRMMNVKHQAALVWAIKHVRTIKGKNVEERQAKTLRNYIKAIQIIMKDGVPKRSSEEKEIADNRAEIEELMQHFADWREHLGMTQGFNEQIGDLEEKKNHVVINYPVFTKEGAADGENDIFYVEGFFKPGNHQIIIYDPKLDAFFKRENVMVAPRKVDLKAVKSDLGPAVQNQAAADNAQEEMTKVYFDQMKGPSLKLVQAHLYGDLLHDMSPQIAEIAFENDFDSKLIDLQRYLGSGKEIDRQGEAAIKA